MFVCATSFVYVCTLGCEHVLWRPLRTSVLFLLMSKTPRNDGNNSCLRNRDRLKINPSSCTHSPKHSNEKNIFFLNVLVMCSSRKIGSGVARSRNLRHREDDEQIEEKARLRSQVALAVSHGSARGRILFFHARSRRCVVGHRQLQAHVQ